MSAFNKKRELNLDLFSTRFSILNQLKVGYIKADIAWNSVG